MSKKVVILSILVLMLAFLGVGILNVVMGRPSLLTAKFSTSAVRTNAEENSSEVSTVVPQTPEVNEAQPQESDKQEVNSFDDVKITRILSMGLNGDDVKKVQSILKDKGYYEGEINGDFTLELKNSVKAFQKSQKITQTGNVGPATLKALTGEILKGN